MNTPAAPANAALLYQPEGFDTSRPKLMGRHAASEGFLKGFVQHSQVDTLYCYTGQHESAEHFAQCVAGFGNRRPVSWLDASDAAAPGATGSLHLPDPSLAAAAWRRRRVGQRRYSISGITHTTASAGAMDMIVELLLAPVQDWDALICTSRVVHDTVTEVLAQQQHYLAARFGARHFVQPRLPIIPLGVDTQAFQPDEAARAAARAEWGIGTHDVVVLFLGRLSFHGKAHPLPMYLGLERVARAGGLAAQGKLHLLQAGWFANDAIEAAFRSGAAQYCPSVVCHFLDARKPAVRRQVWCAADLFSSLSDNIQETFGLAPLEAMAAGLPGVVSDWNGYRDTLRDGIDGLRVPTLMPRAGLGTDLADRHAAGIDSYDRYCAHASQFVAVDIEAATAAYQRLVGDAALRRHMGAAARQRAVEHFDWSVIIRRYQALWLELAQRRASAGESAAPAAAQASHPARMDPMRAFASYPSHTLSPEHRVSLVAGADMARLQALLQSPLLAHMQAMAPNADDCGRVLWALQRHGTLSVQQLVDGMAEPQQARVERGLAWLAKLGLLRVQPPPAAPAG